MSVFNVGDTVIRGAPGSTLTVGRSYTVLSAGQRAVKIMSDLGLDEWFDEQYFYPAPAAPQGGDPLAYLKNKFISYSRKPQTEDTQAVLVFIRHALSDLYELTPTLTAEFK